MERGIKKRRVILQEQKSKNNNKSIYNGYNIWFYFSLHILSLLFMMIIYQIYQQIFFDIHHMQVF